MLKVGDYVDVTFAGASASRPALVVNIANDGAVTLDFNDPRGEWRVIAFHSWFEQQGARWTVLL